MSIYDPPYKPVPVYCDACKAFSVQHKGQHLKCNGNPPVETAVSKMSEKQFKAYSEFRKTTTQIRTAIHFYKQGKVE
jgi:hypothetical protein